MIHHFVSIIDGLIQSPSLAGLGEAQATPHGKKAKNDPLKEAGLSLPPTCGSVNNPARRLSVHPTVEDVKGGFSGESVTFGSGQ
jgi:hypothetical protein